MGDETLLVPDLFNAATWSAMPVALRGPIRPENSCWESGDGIESIPKFGSGNIPKLRWAIRYVRNPAKYNASERLLFLLSQERDSWGFMGWEQFSQIYGLWHLEAHLLIMREALFRNDNALAQLSAEWLQLYFMATAFVYQRGRRVVSAGMRSVGHMADAGLREYVAELSLTAPGQPVAIPAGIAPYLLKSAERGFLDSMRHVIDVCAVSVRLAYPDADKLAKCYVPGWMLLERTHFLRSANGLGMWIDANRNPNTSGVLAGVLFNSAMSIASLLAEYPDVLTLAAPTVLAPDDELPLWLPPGGATRYRSWDQATCVKEDGHLQYESPVWGTHQAPLPLQNPIGYIWSAKSFYRMEWPMQAPPVTPLPAPLPAPTQPPTAPPSPPPPASPVPVVVATHHPDPETLKSIATTLNGLVLPKTQLPLRAAIVANLLSGKLTETPATIANQVATFGIGEGQPQAAAWKDAIAKLRALG